MNAEAVGVSDFIAESPFVEFDVPREQNDQALALEVEASKLVWKPLAVYGGDSDIVSQAHTTMLPCAR